MKYILSLLVFFLVVPVSISSQAAVSHILIRNVQVFDGKNEKTVTGHVLISGNTIAQVSATEIPPPQGAVIIDGKGKFLMPGLIDAHWHAFMGPASPQDFATGDVGYLHTLAAAEAKNTLMRGFTTIRDMAGPVFGLKRAIDEGLVPGPRIYPSGAMVSQTGGHGDFSTRNDVPVMFGGIPSVPERLGYSIVANGKDEVTTAVREQLRLGATQIKLVAGGGASSLYDPLDAQQYSHEELKAAVEAAANWGTYVAVHAYTKQSIISAIEAGVKCIEHGQLADEATIRLIAEKGIWLSTQAFTTAHRDHYTAEQNSKLAQIAGGTEQVYALARKYKVKLAFGTDKLFSQQACSTQNQDLVKLNRWFTPFEILKMATSANGELMALSGPRNPYPAKLGVIEPGAWADVLLIDGNPLEEISLLGNPESNILLIIKNGKVEKNIIL